MKVVGLIPFWMNKGKDRDMVKLSGKYLIEYTIELLNRSQLIEETIIYASNQEFENYLDESLDFSFLKRPLSLDTSTTRLEEIVEEFFKEREDVDIIVLVHPYCPFIKIKTIDECINAVKSTDYDSSLTSMQIKKLSWYKGEPLNFEKNELSPKLKNIEPIIIEHGLTYVIKKDTFKKTKSRIGLNPYFKYINQFEGYEIDNNDDLLLAELIVNSGFHRGAIND